MEPNRLGDFFEKLGNYGCQAQSVLESHIPPSVRLLVHYFNNTLLTAVLNDFALFIESQRPGRYTHYSGIFLGRRRSSIATVLPPGVNASISHDIIED